jgi:hypothetical protein
MQEAEATLITKETPTLEKEPSVDPSEVSTPEPTGKSSEKDLLQPSPTKIIACAIVIAFATMEVAC